MVLLDTETPSTSREIYSEDAEGERGCEFESHLRQQDMYFTKTGRNVHFRNIKIKLRK